MYIDSCPLVCLLTFQAILGDQTVVEGQEVTMSVRMSGQPKPMLYWYVETKHPILKSHFKVLSFIHSCGVVIYSFF